MVDKKDTAPEPGRPTARSERGALPAEVSADQPQEQPPDLATTLSHEADPQMSAKERREAGAEPEDREAEEKRERGRAKAHTVLHSVIHSGETYFPGAEVTLPEVDAAPLRDAGVIVEGTGKKVAHAVHRAAMARHTSLTSSGILAGPPPEPPPSE
jgi:hypothetical protein